MPHRVLDLTDRTLRINLARDEYRQSTSVGTDGVINRSRKLVRVQRAGSNIVLTYFDSHNLKYIIKTLPNVDEYGNPKFAAVGPVTWNAEKIRKWRNEPNYLTQREKETDKVIVEDVPPTDADWKASVRYFGIRDALLGSLPSHSRHR